jgi:hypothetical protein
MPVNEIIETDYATITVSNNGKHIEIDIDENVKLLRHQKHLKAYCQKLYEHGVTKINADQIKLPYLDKKIDLFRGNRRLDLVYYLNGRIHECEFKTKRECGLDNTYNQIKEQIQYCDNFILLVPQSELTYVQDTIRLRCIKKVKVYPYDQTKPGGF